VRSPHGLSLVLTIVVIEVLPAISMCVINIVVSMVVASTVGINMWVLGIIGIKTIEPIIEAFIVRVLVVASYSAATTAASVGINTTACGGAGGIAPATSELPVRCSSSSRGRVRDHQ
jgi:hypothetical protein